MLGKWLSAGIPLAGLVICHSAWAQGAVTLDSAEIEQLRQKLAQQVVDLQKREEAIAAQQSELKAEIQKLQATKRRLDSLTEKASAKKGVVPSDKQVVGTRSSAQPEPVGQAPHEVAQSRPPTVAPIFEQPGVLTPHGKWVVEPSLEYSYSSNNRVTLVGYTIIPAITIGLIDIRRVDLNTFVGALTVRYGLTNRMEVGLKIPYVNSFEQSVARPLNVGSSQDSLFNARGRGLGDVELALRYQFNNGGNGNPYYVGSLRIKTRTGRDPFEINYAPASSAATGMIKEQLPTGSGFYGIQPGLTVIYPSDPAVLFGGVNYLWNIKRKIDKTVAGQYFGTVEPGDAFGFNFGMGFSLNERTSFSIGYEGSVVGKTRVDGQAAPGATSVQLGTLLLGYAYQYSPGTSFNLSLGAGLTQDTPDVQITLRVPMTF